MEAEQQRVLKKMKFENGELDLDRLSNLPYDIIYHILSLMDTKYAVQTCVLSKGWKNLWTGIQSLNLEVKTFSRWSDYERFVRGILRHRKPCDLRRLVYNCGGRKGKALASRIFNYAQAHNLEELETDVDASNFPPRLYECQSLRTLKLGPDSSVEGSINPSGFKWLTTLRLFKVWLSSPSYTIYSSQNYNNGLFSSFLNLKNLFLIECQMVYLGILNISAPQLVDLTISNLQCSFFPNSSYEKRLVITAPRLKFLEWNGKYTVILRTDKYLRLNIHILPTSLLPVNMYDIGNIIYMRDLTDWHLNLLVDQMQKAEGLAHAKLSYLDLCMGKSITCHRNRDTPFTAAVTGIEGELHIDLGQTIVFSWAPANFVAKWVP